MRPAQEKAEGEPKVKKGKTLLDDDDDEDNEEGADESADEVRVIHVLLLGSAFRNPFLRWTEKFVG